MATKIASLMCNKFGGIRRINCGLRISDILRLNVGDVRNRTHIQITEQKTGKFKKFPINSKLKPMIDDFIKGRRNRRTFYNNTGEDVTIREIGIYLFAHQGSTYSPGGQPVVMIGRKVLPNPIVIPNGQ